MKYFSQTVKIQLDLLLPKQTELAESLRKQNQLFSQSMFFSVENRTFSSKLGKTSVMQRHPNFFFFNFWAFLSIIKFTF